MPMNYGMDMGPIMGLPISGPLLVALLIWSFFWKGLAFWHSAQRGQYWWFIIMLFVNTLGILEIIYLFAVAKLTFAKLFTSRR
jgi:hypothetical protein